MIKNYNRMMRHAGLSDFGMALGNNNAAVWVMLSVINKFNGNNIFHYRLWKQLHKC